MDPRIQEAHDFLLPQACQIIASGEDIEAIFFFRDEQGGYGGIPVAHLMEHKEAMVTVVRALADKIQPVLVAFVSEAWSARIPKGEKLEGPVRDHPSREEMLVLSIEIKGEGASWHYPIKKDDRAQRVVDTAAEDACFPGLTGYNRFTILNPEQLGESVPWET